MNKNQVKGATKAGVGKLERATGKLVGSRKLEAKGAGKQLAGKAQQRVGDVQESIKDSRKKDRR
ncbi:MAG: CsbD family protein [Planctomycetes bacterium]|nr:CsbD family protein [Planctomycetota bacterium]